MRITVDGRQVGYDDSGGAGIPLVLLHGFGADRTAWDAVVPELGERRVIRPDFRGAGESEAGAGPALMEVLAGDLDALLDALQVERAVLVGHSLGGYAAFAFFRMYAERTAGLAFVASQARADSPAAAAARDALAETIERERSMDAAVAAYAPRLVAPEFARRHPERLSQLIARMARADPLGSAQLMRGMRERLDSSDLFGDIDVPVVVLCGSEDALVPIAAAREIAHGIAGAALVEFDGVGHSVPSEDPVRTGTALRAFAQRVPR